MGKRTANKQTTNQNSHININIKKSSQASSSISAPEISNESNECSSEDEVISSSELSFSSSNNLHNHNHNHNHHKNNHHKKVATLSTSTTTPVVVNRVVSSNPTLNLLLSTPIKTTANTGKSAGTGGGSNRSKKTKQQQNAKTKVTSAIGGTRTSSGSAKLSICGGNVEVKSGHTSSSSLTQQQQISFVDEISKMMHSFGDTKIPMPESAKLIESIVKHQLSMIMEEAELIATQRNSNTTIIGHEELLFLLKNDRHKLARLIRHLSFKDLKPKIVSNIDSCCDPVSLAEPPLYNQQNNSTEDDDNSTNVDQLSSTTFIKPNHCQTKRIKLCHQFLSEIETPFGHCSEPLMKVFNEDFVDRITSCRNRRLSAFTETLAIKDYYYYQSCRSVSFLANNSSTGTPTSASAGHKTNKFYEWFVVPYYNDRCSSRPKTTTTNTTNTTIIKPNSLAVEILQYLAHETVAILVELALVIRDEHNSQKPEGGSTTDKWSAQFSKKYHEAQKKATTTNSKPTTLALGGEGRHHLVGDILSRASASMISLQKSCSSTPSSHTNGSTNSGSAPTPIFSKPSTTQVPNRSSGGHQRSSFHNRFIAANSITPANIMEAMRRFERTIPNNFLSRFSRSHSMSTSSRRHKILCL